MLQDMSLSFSFLLGVIHSLEPGHGKTALMAYMLSGKKNIFHALTMALSSALSHSFSLFIIALITHLAGHALIDGQVDSSSFTHALEWIGALSILAIGLFLIIRFYQTKETSEASCCHKHGHEHHQKPQQGYKLAALLGISTGIIPCPTALAAYLSGIANGQIQSAFLILISFSLGLILSFLIVATFIKYAGDKLKKFNESKTLNTAFIHIRNSIILMIGLVYVGKLIIAH